MALLCTEDIYFCLEFDERLKRRACFHSWILGKTLHCEEKIQFQLCDVTHVIQLFISAISFFTLSKFLYSNLYKMNSVISNLISFVVLLEELDK